ncbi:RNA polymerase sigma factor [Fibrisoma montanum]|nr:RNA polymerase sigma factor [Fibrisoma montanum]
MTAPKTAYLTPWPKLIEQHTSFVRACARKLIADTDDYKDLAQDVLVKALMSEDKYNPEGGNLKGWLSAICYNEFVTRYNRAKRFKKVDEPDDSLYERVGTLGISQNEGVTAFEVDLIDKALDSLKGMNADLMRMRADGHRYEELATHFDLPVGTIKNRIFINRQKLQTYMTAPRHNVLATPVSMPGTSAKPDNAEAWQKALDYLTEQLDPATYRRIDAVKLIKATGVPMHLGHALLGALSDAGALVRQPFGNGYEYISTPELATFDPAKAEELARKRYQGGQGTGKKKGLKRVVNDLQTVVPLSNSIHLVRSVGLEPTNHVPVREMVSAKNADIGDVWGFTFEGQTRWFSSIAEAAEQAKQELLNRAGSIDLVRKVGVVQVAPTVTLFE